MNIPTTRRSPKAELVAKDGASALTSHLYRPVVLCTRLVSVLKKKTILLISCKYITWISSYRKTYTCFEFDLCLSTSTPSRTYTVIGWSFCGKNLRKILKVLNKISILYIENLKRKIELRHYSESKMSKKILKISFSESW